MCFDEANKNVNQYREWKQMILHQFSLLHALSMQCLRLDDQLDNLVVFNRLEGHANDASARDISLGERAGRYTVSSEVLLSAVNEGLNRELAPSMPDGSGGAVFGISIAEETEADEADEAEALAAAEVTGLAVDIESGLGDVDSGPTRRRSGAASTEAGVQSR